MRTIFTALAPNLEKDDAIRSLKLIFTPWEWKDEKPVRDLEKAVAQKIKVNHGIAFESGRTALVAALKALPIKEGDEVALQAFTCVAVPDAISWAQMKPLFIDCDPETLTISPEDLKAKINPRTRGLIVQYTLGRTPNWEEILKIAKKHNLWIIEDCAHGIGGHHKGQPIGSIGHAAIFSFGRDKAVSSVFGGVAVTNDDTIASNLRSVQHNYEQPKASWIFQQLLYAPLVWCVKITYDYLIGRFLWIGIRRLNLLSRSVLPEEKLGKAPSFVFHRFAGALAVLALEQLKKVDRFNDHRLAIFELYQKGFAEKEILQSIVLKEGEVPLRLIFRSKNREIILKEGSKQSIYLGDWYTNVIAPPGVDYDYFMYKEGSCPNAEAAAREVLNLPLDIHIERQDVERILSLLKTHQ
ncbi:MAG: DegT/DnrJ/EryC1/StrS aminotransferase family protein [Anaplasmataceae bacterium]|nr:DegT/DnrJ/EryC1/StrS aminotransferase family protein [Anaplasmataceae bacterium]